MHFYCICHLLLGVDSLPVNIYPRNKRKMVCLQEKASGVSLQPRAGFTDHTDLKTKHFILKKKKKNQTVSLNMAYNQSPDPWCFTQLPRLPHEWAFNGTFITNNKHNGSCGGNQRVNVTRRKVWPSTHSVPPPSLASSWAALRTSFHTLSRLDFLLLYPTFSYFWPFYPLFLLSVNSCSFLMVILHCIDAPWRQGSHCIMGSWHVGRNNQHLASDCCLGSTS